MSYLIKNLHFIVIHIPIAMLIFGFLFDLFGKLLRKPEWHTAGLLCLIVGTLGAIAAVLTGPEDRNPLVHTHEFYGKITMFLFIILTLVRLFFHLKKKRELGGSAAYLAVALIGVLLVGYTGHIGGQMVHPDRSKFPPGQMREGGQQQGGANGQGGPGQGQRQGGPNAQGGAGQGQGQRQGVPDAQGGPGQGQAPQGGQPAGSGQGSK
ncbi:DUF2231 domain-containing protein [Paenibacillus hamazuiensis]|uniref:DUF2231 domain-containing protein n=1 Tax=Paenibacillus hamazuiensis TaxID=2936508 RepID=UPI0020101C3C|nr:DUF2231 domain-containing protein [Paenibacillus hamazuiensis]